METPSTSLTLQKATDGDIKSIQHIVQETWPETYGPIIGAQQVQYMLDLIYAETALLDQLKQGHVFFILRQDATAIGFIDVQLLNNKISKLHKIYLLSTQQGKGYGRLLLERAFQEGASNGSSVLQLNVNRLNKALNFYKKMGFAIKEEVDIAIGGGYFMNDYVMEKIL